MKAKVFTVNGQRRTANGFSPFSLFRSPFSVLLFALLACSEEAMNTDTDAGKMEMEAIPIAFTDHRGGAQGDGILPLSAGDRTTDNLADMTVYAHYTGTADFDDATSTPNFMFAQPVNKSDGTWTYTPQKYWPWQHEKVSFFAIAPGPNATNGIALVGGNAYTGYPSFTVTPPPTAVLQEDLCVAAALNRTDNTDDGKVPFTFAHVMAKVTFSVRYKGSMSTGEYVKIKQLYVSQVAKSGTLSLTAGSFSWNVPAGADNRTDYFLSLASGDLTDADLLEEDASGSSLVSTNTGTLLLIPQTTSAEAEIQLVATFYNGATEKDYEIATTLPVTTWDVGKQITYNLVIDLSKGYMEIDVPDPIEDEINQWNYSYTGTVQTFTAPQDGYYLLEAWGAGGTSEFGSLNEKNGAYVSGEIFLKQDQLLLIYAGESTTERKTAFNGGAHGTGATGASGTGGGATDFRLLGGDWDNASSLNSRILVAGGGGGTGYDSNGGGGYGHGGAGGGLTGDNGGVYNIAVGGKGGGQTSGGTGVTHGAYTSSDGSFGKGSNGNSNTNVAGGGGGYYGGSGAARQISSLGAGGGGGGSSFISGMTNCVAINPTTTTDPREQDSNGNTAALNYNSAFGTSLTWNNGAEIIFTNYSMIDGAGHEWNTGEKVEPAVGMPNWNGGGTMTGNAGAGHARITLLLND
jgi:hypothetical protein